MSKRPYKSYKKSEEETELNKVIGKRIKEARKSRIIFVNVPEIKNISTTHTIKKQKLCTQTELAKALDVTFQQIQKYEKGFNGLSSIKLLKISRFFGKPLKYFTDEAVELLGQGDLPGNNPEKTLAPTIVSGLN